MRNIFIGAAAIAALAGSAALFAATDANSVQHSVAVRYAGLNANSTEGASALYARLRSAAKAACGTAPGRGLAAVSDFNACRSDALSEAERQPPAALRLFFPAVSGRNSAPTMTVSPATATGYQSPA